MILSRMERCCTPNQVHFNSVINACANERPSAVHLAEPVLKTMLQHGYKPNSFTLSALFRCAGFSQPPRPDLAREWFNEYCHSGTVDINDHVTRALYVALGDEAEDLLASVGSPRASRRPRRNRCSSFKNRNLMDWRSSESRETHPSATLFANRRSASWRSERSSPGRSSSTSCDNSRSPSPTLLSSIPAVDNSVANVISFRTRMPLAEKINALKLRRDSNLRRDSATYTTSLERKPMVPLFPPSCFAVGHIRAPCGPDNTRGFTAQRSTAALAF